MIGLLQRVSRASVEVNGRMVGEIGPGMLVLLAVEPGDTPSDADTLADRLVQYRVFPDEAGRMNLSLVQAGGSLLLVPQFTLAADTRRGLRPSFTGAAPPELGQALFDRAVAAARRRIGDARVATGRFGAHMQVSLVNDGPVTFWLRHPARDGSD